MSVEQIIRAWKDEDFRTSLSAAERAILPEHPAGQVRQDRSGLHPGQPGADGLGEHARPPVAGEPGDQRVDHLT